MVTKYSSVSVKCLFFNTHPGDGRDVATGHQEEASYAGGVCRRPSSQDGRPNHGCTHLSNCCQSNMLIIIVEYGNEVVTRGPMIHRGLFPVKSDMKPQAKSVTMVTRLAHAGIMLHWVTLYPMSPIN